MITIRQKKCKIDAIDRKLYANLAFLNVWNCIEMC